MIPSAQQQFQATLAAPDEAIDLARAALCIGQQHKPELDLDAYLQRLDHLADQIRPRLPAERYPLRIIQTINQHLFDDLGFCGNQADYYDPRNSFLNDVLDRRTGIPIALSVLYLEVAKRLDFPMVGVGMPGHFLIRPQGPEMAIYVDPFQGGEVLFAEDCQQRLEGIYQRRIQFQPDLLPDVSSRPILQRMLTNLKLIYLRKNKFGNALDTIDWLLLLSPENRRERRDRGLVLYELKRYDEAILDLQRYLESNSEFELTENVEVIRKLLEQLRRL